MRRFSVPPSSEITPESVYLDRRTFLAAAGIAGAGLLGAARGGLLGAQDPAPRVVGTPMGLQAGDVPTSYEDVTTYNNFYEFGTGKDLSLIHI